MYPKGSLSTFVIIPKPYGIMKYSRNARLRRDFPRPPGERCPRRPFGKPPPSAVVKEKRKEIWGAPHRAAAMKKKLGCPKA